MKLDARSMLWIFLVRLRQSWSLRIVAWLFSCSAATILRVFDDVMAAILKLAEQRIQIPSLQERLTNGVTFYDDIVTVIIDGSEQQVSVSLFREIERGTFSGKKAKHTFTILLAVAPNGKIYYLSPSQPGAKHDFAVISLPENFFWRHLEEFEAIGADKGYVGLDKLVAPNPVILPVSKPKTREQEEFNNEFAAIRTIVENVFAQIKKWKMCKNTFKINGDINNAKEKHNQIWRAACFLVNEYVDMRPVK
jgi:hypothetical protein